MTSAPENEPRRYNRVTRQWVPFDSQAECTHQHWVTEYVEDVNRRRFTILYCRDCGRELRQRMYG